MPRWLGLMVVSAGLILSPDRARGAVDPDAPAPAEPPQVDAIGLPSPIEIDLDVPGPTVPGQPVVVRARLTARWSDLAAVSVRLQPPAEVVPLSADHVETVLVLDETHDLFFSLAGGTPGTHLIRVTARALGDVGTVGGYAQGYLVLDPGGEARFHADHLPVSPYSQPAVPVATLPPATFASGPTAPGPATGTARPRDPAGLRFEEPLGEAAPPSTAAADTFVVTGCWTYVDENGFSQRQRWATVWVWDSDAPFGNDLLWSGITGTDGCFTSDPIPRSEPCCLRGNQDVFVQFVATNTWTEVQTNGGQTYDAFTPENTVNDTQTVMDIGAWGPPIGEEFAWRPFQYLNNGGDFARNRAGIGGLGVVTVFIPDADFCDACYTRSNDTIHLAADGVWDRSPDDVNHEYGHYVMDKAYGDAYWPSPGGIHFLCDDNQDRGLSWAEGYADFFGPRANNEMAPIEGADGDVLYNRPLDGTVFSVDMETPTSCSVTPLGDDNELNVAFSLWDLRDTPNDGQDDSSDSIAFMSQLVEDCDDFSYNDHYNGEGAGANSPACSWDTQGGNRCNFVRTALQNNIDFRDAEVCDGVDNDCDRLTDEGVGVPGCITFFRDQDGDGFGVTGDTRCTCSSTGLYRATTGGDCDDANGAIHPGAVEVCNNADDDCDGTTDGFPTACGVGECAAGGVCTAGVDSCAPGAPLPEVCDGLDNDCNGVVDEFATACGIGECVATGFCSAGLDSCSPGAPVAEVCDALDNDCDGSTDEDFPVLGDACALGIGECRRSGLQVCSADGTTTVCNAVPRNPFPERCDNLDNDCDGLVDEGGVCVDFSVGLSLAWNLVGPALDLLPPQGSSYSAADLCDDVVADGGAIREVDRWTPFGWQAHVCGLPFNDFPVEDGEGYFVYSAGVSTWQQFGGAIRAPLPVDTPVAYSLLSVPGWKDELLTAGSVCNEIPEATAVFHWINAAASWQSFDCAYRIGTDFAIVPGAGYFVRTATGARWILDTHRLTNLGDVGFTVSWFTDTPTVCHVEFEASGGGAPQSAGDVRSGSGEEHGPLHYVDVTGLQPETEYRYVLACDRSVCSVAGIACTTDADCDPPNNDLCVAERLPGDLDGDGTEERFRVTTATTLTPRPPDTAYGQAYCDGATCSGGVNAGAACAGGSDCPGGTCGPTGDNTVAYLQVRNQGGGGSPGRSTWLSDLIEVGDGGYWNIDLTRGRETALTNWFVYDAADAERQSVKSASGGVIQSVLEPDDQPSPTMQVPCP